MLSSDSCIVIPEAWEKVRPQDEGEAVGQEGAGGVGVEQRQCWCWSGGLVLGRWLVGLVASLMIGMPAHKTARQKINFIFESNVSVMPTFYFSSFIHILYSFTNLSKQRTQLF